MAAGAAAAKLVGSTFAGKYRVVQLLRGGGAADVYLAEPLTLPPAAPGGARAPRPSRLALKVLREKLRGDAAMVRRFERGVDAESRIVHPNVVRTGPLEHLPDGLPFCTMELLIGMDLADTLAAGRRIDAARAARIVSEAAAGLGAAHEAGVVHLDVKPENIFLVHQADGGELVKMLDFGLAAVRGDRAAPGAGTPEYMAPEQRRGAPAAPAMDVYALGLVLHEMLSGHPPSAPRWLAAEIPLGISKVIHRATQESPAARFASMAELQAALAEALEEPPPRRVGGSRR